MIISNKGNVREVAKDHFTIKLKTDTGNEEYAICKKCSDDDFSKGDILVVCYNGKYCIAYVKSLSPLIFSSLDKNDTYPPILNTDDAPASFEVVGKVIEKVTFERIKQCK